MHYPRIQKPLLECIPPVELLHEYQEFAVGSISIDEAGLVRGWRPRPYFLRGVHEELLEITERPTANDGAHKEEAHYDRLLRLIGLNPLDKEIHKSEDKLHQKEFGDSSWYLFNCLNDYGIPLDKVLESGKRYIEFSQISARADEEFVIQNQGALPWLNFTNYSKDLEKAITGMLRGPEYGIDRNTPISELHSALSEEELKEWYNNTRSRDERGLQETYLMQASGRFIISTSHVLECQFETSMEAILIQNRRKLAEREARGTVLKNTDGSGGGDDR